ncbi:repressor protein [Klebsiella variicola]|uniref:phage repressor protein CI n=1 Tax=Klebsiella variicola TaxID=244366 RepID=UPI000D749049|nr:phage repressor protein CI [Klebsiella variicola]PXH33342.1 CI repressor [Klebsiella variicola]SXD75671.1 repressor protein [Klebsiella variicola]HCT8728700.1 phage repressor protein CI [Klebsiella pneumoniae]
MNLKTGGQAVITRLLEAYGFKTRQALCNQLNVSTSTMGTRWMRDVFPADWVIQCSIETGASVEWLSFGNGAMFPNGHSTHSNETKKSANENLLGDVVAVPRKKIVDGNLYDSNFYMLDKAILPENILKPLIIIDDDLTYVAEHSISEITDGTWLVEIEGKVSIKELIRIPVGKIRVSSPTGGYAFECGINDLTPLAKCHYYLMTNV